MEFLYSLNRLNVATSRAQAMVIIVGSPRLLEPGVPQSAANAVGECALPPRSNGSSRREAIIRQSAASRYDLIQRDIFPVSAFTVAFRREENDWL
jgi:hypothetical protein